MAKKSAKKASKPVKKKEIKKAAKKQVAKNKSAKAAKPKAKPAAKKPLKKAKPSAKKVVAKAKAKPAPKKAAKPSKTAGRPVAKKAAPKVIAKAKAVPTKAELKKQSIAAKPEKVKKEAASIDNDDVVEAKKTNSERTKSNDEFFSSFVYKPMVKKPANQPKPHISKDKRTRFTDKELAEFKGIIEKKLAEALHDYEMLKNSLSHKDDHGTDDTSPTFKLLEDGSDVLSKEETAHLAARQEKYIQNLKNALIRIENKSYGICRATGRLISKERLRSVPHATLDIDAKLEQSY
jgi:RNA polymerase-binding transcription factor DksA